MRHRNAALLAAVTAGAIGAVPVLAAAGGNGVSLSPPIVEHLAKVGNVGAVSIANNSGKALKVTVTPRPWIQGSSGVAVPNLRARVGSVAPSEGSFTLPSGSSRSVSFALTSFPAHGSLYASIDVTALPAAPSNRRNVVNLGYRLVGSLRLTPTRPVYGARVGRLVVTGNSRRGTLALAIRNTGNTILPYSGPIYLRGPRGWANGAVSATTVLPGATVNVPVLNLTGSLPAGSYTVSGAVEQGGRRLLNINKQLTLR